MVEFSTKIQEIEFPQSAIECTIGTKVSPKAVSLYSTFKGGFFVGACGSAGFVFICLSSIPTFPIN